MAYKNFSLQQFPDSGVQSKTPLMHDPLCPLQSLRKDREESITMQNVSNGARKKHNIFISQKIFCVKDVPLSSISVGVKAFRMISAL